MSSLVDPPVFSVSARAPGRITLTSQDGHVAHVFVLEPDIVRLLVLPDGRLKAPRTWAIAPGEEDVPAEGRDRFDLSGFALPGFTLTEDGERIVIETAAVRLTIR